MKRVLSAAGGFALAAVGLPAIMPAATVPAPTISGCGTAAIPKASLNDVTKLRAERDCWRAAMAKAEAPYAQRVNRLAALSAPVPTPSPTVATFASASLDYQRRFANMTDAQRLDCWQADRAAIVAMSARSGEQAALAAYAACGR